MRMRCNCCEGPPRRPRRALGTPPAATKAARCSARATLASTVDDPADMPVAGLGARGTKLTSMSACQDITSHSECARPSSLLSPTNSMHKRTRARMQQIKTHMKQQPNTQPNERTNEHTQTNKGKHTDVQQTQRHINTATHNHRTTCTCPHVHVCACS